MQSRSILVCLFGFLLLFKAIFRTILKCYYWSDSVAYSTSKSLMKLELLTYFKNFRSSLKTRVELRQTSMMELFLRKQWTVFKHESIQRFSFTKICTEKYLQSEIDFLIDIFTENGHNRNKLSKIATEYLWNINKPKSNDQNNNKNTKNVTKLSWVPILGPKLQKEF